MEDRNKLKIETTRLVNHLVHNQLVQSHAILQKIESIINECIISDAKNKNILAEQHPFWIPMRLCVIVKNYILSGNNKEALRVSRQFEKVL